jgi:hypothetical protein
VYSIGWIGKYPQIAIEMWSSDLGIPIESLSVIARDKAHGIYDLTVWKKGAPVACHISGETSPVEAHDQLAEYLLTPDNVRFDFRRDGFVTIIFDPA